MSYLSQDLAPLLAALLVASIAWFVRTQNTARARRRIRQLDQAAELIDVHARMLERFLDDPAAPIALKRVLLACSDAAADRNAVGKLIAWAASRSLHQPVDTDEIRALADALDYLRTSRPDLAEDFATAVMTAVAGASLRWPENAELFDCAFPRLMTTPRRDVAIAVTAASLRPGIPFSMRHAGTAVA